MPDLRGRNESRMRPVLRRREREDHPHAARDVPRDDRRRGDHYRNDLAGAAAGDCARDPPRPRGTRPVREILRRCSRRRGCG